MKKLFPVITLVIGLVAGYYLFSLKGKSGATDTITGDNLTSQNGISMKEAKTLIDTFSTHWMEDAKQRVGGKGEITRSAFIPLKELDSLVAALDAARKRNGVTDGIRIYMGRYPKMQPDGKTPYPQAYHNTIVLVTTKYTRILSKGAKDSIYIHKDFYGLTNRKVPVYLFGDDPLDRTQLCPNDCQGATMVCTDPTDPTCTGNSNN
jgi:hypothetical protein